MSISAFLPIFNEESRIAQTLISLQWCDEIILLDKNSTDATVEIARGFGEKVKIYFMENSEIYNASEFDYILKYSSSEWVIIFTASDVIDRDLTQKILKLIHQPGFRSDIVHIPYRRYVLGLETKRSPWYTELHPAVFRKSSLVIDKSEVHGAIKFTGVDYYMKNEQEDFMYHLTHESVDGMMARHIRYWRAEGLNSVDESMKTMFKPVLRCFKNVLLKKKTYLLGWDGVALMCAYLSYHMMSFVYKWEAKSSKAADRYQEIRKNIENDWRNN